MDTYFIINPVSGNGKSVSFIEKIKETGQAHIHTTTEKGGAEQFVRKIAAGGKPCRFYAVGGDGTFGEIINGAYGYDNAAVGIVPAGTGNDFIRCFKSNESFFDIDAQLNGTVKEIDTVKTVMDGSFVRRFVNMGNIGFDCNVVINSEKVKNKYSFNFMSYIIGIVEELIKKWGQNVKITFDDGTVYDSCQLLCTIANGKYCGGGFLSSPKSDMSDGLMDVAVIDKIRKIDFISLIAKYRNGTYLEDIKAKDIITYKQVKSMKMEMEETQGICIDGDIYFFKTAEFENERHSIKLIVPQGAEE